MTKFIAFSSDISKISIPQKFDYPHNYTPHSLAKIATEELQTYLNNQKDFSHNFGIKNPNDKNALGKMFGVLVVKNNNNELGYLSAFSGKIAGKTQHKHFVPPVYDILNKGGIFLKTTKLNNDITQKIIKLESNNEYLRVKKEYLNQYYLYRNIIDEEKKKIKKQRKLRRLEGNKNNQLNINEEFFLREYQIYLVDKISILEKNYHLFQQEIQQLKQQQKEISTLGQEEIFKKYQFLNRYHKAVNLITIFNNSTQNIPAGSGDCCAPKLLQYAFIKNLTPICMAEFWWGKPSANAVRKHKNYYTACTGKCKPILKHMLEGLCMDENPLISELQDEKTIEVIFEDTHLIVINKPKELLSVPGKEIKDSVYNRIKKCYPKATGPLVVHRLDMSTSGLLLIAKNLAIYKELQAQFVKRTIKKRYVALLNGILTKKKGEINLPLRVNLENRPKQLVCKIHGKKAHTIWEVVNIKKGKTKVYFYPTTGRTHQLRVHSAHHLGLNIAILGDNLYGNKADRLYLHAEKIGFIHPINKKWIEFDSPADF